MKRAATAALFVILALFLAPADVSAKNPAGKKSRVKYVIFMLTDGMGLPDVTAARIKKNGINGAPLHFETLEHVGYQRTYSANNTVTDSAAGASAMACGEKFVNGEICFHADGRATKPSLLEIAKSKGMSTGLVATSTITHASPASFGSHVQARACENEIARQYIFITQPDVILGGGLSKFTATAPDKCGAFGDYVAAAKERGYVLAHNRSELQSVLAGSQRKVLGLFNASALTPEYLRKPEVSEPRLPEMASAALRLLEKDQDGFFLFIEGSQIDWGNHDNNLDYQTGELLAFDEAVRVVLDWVNARPERKEQTLIVVAPDHETGGFAIRGDEAKPGLGPFSPAWVTKGHTGTDVVIWSQGPHSERLGRAIDNTFVYTVIENALR